MGARQTDGQAGREASSSRRLQRLEKAKKKREEGKRHKNAGETVFFTHSTPPPSPPPPPHRPPPSHHSVSLSPITSLGIGSRCKTDRRKDRQTEKGRQTNRRLAGRQIPRRLQPLKKKKKTRSRHFLYSQQHPPTSTPPPPSLPSLSHTFPNNLARNREWVRDRQTDRHRQAKKTETVQVDSVQTCQQADRKTDSPSRLRPLS